MKYLLLFFTILALIYTRKTFEKKSELPSFEKYYKDYKKHYNLTEYKKHEIIYNENIQKIKNHNLKPHSFILGVNNFTDQSKEEMEKMLGFRHFY